MYVTIHLSYIICCHSSVNKWSWGEALNQYIYDLRIVTESIKANIVLNFWLWTSQRHRARRVIQNMHVVSYPLSHIIDYTYLSIFFSGTKCSLISMLYSPGAHILLKIVLCLFYLPLHPKVNQTIHNKVTYIITLSKNGDKQGSRYILQFKGISLVSW